MRIGSDQFRLNNATDPDSVAMVLWLMAHGSLLKNHPSGLFLNVRVLRKDRCHIQSWGMRKKNRRQYISVIYRCGHITYLDYVGPFFETFFKYRFPAVRVVADGEEVCNEPALVFVGNIFGSARLGAVSGIVSMVHHRGAAGPTMVCFLMRIVLFTLILASQNTASIVDSK